MILEYNLERQDVYQFHLFQTFKKNKRSNRKYVYLAFTLIVLIYQFYKEIFVQEKFPYFSLCWIVFIVSVFLLSPFFMKKQLWRNINKPENDGIFGELTLNCTPSKMELIKDDIHSVVKWNNFLKKEENESYYFLYNSEHSAIVIPKGKVKDQLEDLELLLKEKLG